MANALSITEVGMLNAMEHLNFIAHNMANASTAGFKRDIAVAQPFSDILARGVGDMAGVRLDAQKLVATRFTDHSAGTLSYTGNRLDVAIEGDGFFVLTTPEGPLYTRRGSFTLNAAGQLSTTEGFAVNTLEGDIRLATDQPRIDRQGAVWDGERYMGRLKIVRFDDLNRLEKRGSGLYAGGKARELSAAEDGIRVRQGYIEASNVNVMSEMVELISTMRQIESSQKVLRGYDEMMDVAIRTISDV
ncbi:MAG TPA: flagellar hook basal-body protein [Gammaproteobacteria bacterium]|nr:flagellar hook basal-body protein [Gammaproteobacteria bacterium]